MVGSFKRAWLLGVLAVSVVLVSCSGDDGASEPALSGADREGLCSPIRQVLSWEEENPSLSARGEWTAGSSLAHDRAIEAADQRAAALAEIQDYAPGDHAAIIVELREQTADASTALAKFLADNPPPRVDGLQLIEDIPPAWAIAVEGSDETLAFVSDTCNVDVGNWNDDYLRQ